MQIKLRSSYVHKMSEPFVVVVEFGALIKRRSGIFPWQPDKKNHCTSFSVVWRCMTLLLQGDPSPRVPGSVDIILKVPWA